MSSKLCQTESTHEVKMYYNEHVVNQKKSRIPGLVAGSDVGCKCDPNQK